MRIALLAALLLSTSAMPQAYATEVIYRATPMVILPSGGPPKAELGLTEVTASISSGLPTGPATMVDVRNTGTGASGVVSLSLGGSPYFSISGGTCVSGTTVLAAGASCTVGVARTATTNDVTRSANLVATFAAGTSATAAVSGSAGGFLDAVVPATVAYANGGAWSLKVTPAGGMGPYTFVLTGTRPSGVSATPSTTALTFSGSTTTAGTYSYSVKITDARGSEITKNVAVTVQSPFGFTQNPSYVSIRLAGSAGSGQLQMTGLPAGCSYSVSSDVRVTGSIYTSSYNNGTATVGVNVFVRSGSQRGLGSALSVVATCGSLSYTGSFTYYLENF